MRLGHRRRLSTTARSQQEGGYVLVHFALLLVPLLLMAGLSVDVGFWYNRASDIQKAADAAALAGVVWLPDENKAETYALGAASRNGFVDGVDGVTIDVRPVGERRLRVTIRDREVGSFFFESLGGHKIDVSRSGTAEYVLPVPLGSPHNYFGTGSLLPASSREYLYQSVNPSCTSKINGDRHQSPHYGPLYTSGQLAGASLSSCPSTPTNTDYRDDGYALYVEAPENRSSAIDVRLYDPRYSTEDLDYQVEDGEDCANYPSDWTGPTGSSSNVTITGPALYETKSSSGASWAAGTLNWPNTYTFRGDRFRYRQGAMDFSPAAPNWTGPATSGTSNLTINGPAQYQTRGSTATYGPTVNLPAGQSFQFRRDRLKYRTGSIRPICTPRYRTETDSAIDSKRQSGDESFTYSLYAPDLTPFDDSDNPLVTGCSKTYSASTAFELSYLGSLRWNNLCTITTDMAAGRYIMRVKNGAPGTLTADGSNQWGVVAKYQGASGDGLCDGRDDATCPRVYGRDAISVYANTQGAVASFYLAEIPDYHVGKTLQLELWDPGEGGQTIEILEPDGAESWTPHTFSWESFTDSGTSVDSEVEVESVSVLNNVFNGRLLQIQISLDDYDPPDGNDWWKIRYTFRSDANVTDRTTWSARVIGDPVHLVEEDV